MKQFLNKLFGISIKQKLYFIFTICVVNLLLYFIMFDYFNIVNQRKNIIIEEKNVLVSTYLFLQNSHIYQYDSTIIQRNVSQVSKYDSVLQRMVAICYPYQKSALNSIEISDIQLIKEGQYLKKILQKIQAQLQQELNSKLINQHRQLKYKSELKIAHEAIIVAIGEIISGMVSYRTSYLIYLILFSFVSILFMAYYAYHAILKQVLSIQNFAKRTLTGQMSDIDQFVGEEFTEIAKALKLQQSNFKEAKLLIDKIGDGQYDDAHFENNKFLHEHSLGKSLLRMREKLHTVAQQDQKRNWVSDGLNKFGEIIRQNTNNVEVLVNDLLSQLVDFLNINQGAIFIRREHEKEVFLEKVASYAWGKTNFNKSRVKPGEGLLGQVWLEKTTLFLKEVPEDYVTIGSGLGEAKPTCILITPICINENVLGAIELASFKEFEDYEVDFIEKISENIASTITISQNNERTLNLLKTSQEQSERMKNQEEQMRKSLEDMSASQDELIRKQESFKLLEEVLHEKFGVLELNHEYVITKANQFLSTQLGWDNTELHQKNISELFGIEHELEQIKYELTNQGVYSQKINLLNKQQELVPFKVDIRPQIKQKQVIKTVWLLDPVVTNS